MLVKYLKYFVIIKPQQTMTQQTKSVEQLRDERLEKEAKAILFNQDIEKENVTYKISDFITCDGLAFKMSIKAIIEFAKSEAAKQYHCGEPADIEKIEQDIYDLFDKHTSPTGGGYEADYTNKYSFISDLVKYITPYLHQPSEQKYEFERLKTKNSDLVIINSSLKQQLSDLQGKMEGNIQDRCNMFGTWLNQNFESRKTTYDGFYSNEDNKCSSVEELYLVFVNAALWKSEENLMNHRKRYGLD